MSVFVIVERVLAKFKARFTSTMMTNQIGTYESP